MKTFSKVRILTILYIGNLMEIGIDCLFSNNFNDLLLLPLISTLLTIPLAWIFLIILRLFIKSLKSKRLVEVIFDFLELYPIKNLVVTFGSAILILYVNNVNKEFFKMYNLTLGFLGLSSIVGVVIILVSRYGRRKDKHL